MTAKLRCCLFLLPWLLACAQPPGDDTDADVGIDTVEDLVDLPPDVPPDLPPDRPDVADDGPDISSVLIYAHSADTLYSFSPYTLTVTEIGVFELPDGSEAPLMFDLAVNEAGDLYTSSDTSLYRCNPTTAVVTLVGEFGLAEGEELYALTFLPEGVLRSDREAMIGATNAGAYYEVNVATAAATYLGQYPDGWLSSGDIVSIVGLGTYATLKRYDYPTSDVLAEMTFRGDGSVSARVIGSIVHPGGEQFRELFGLGYWGRSLYGFSNSGQLVEIDRNTGEGTLVTTATGTDQFWGAGVTTIAPVIF
jgi:hypothetical protein